MDRFFGGGIGAVTSNAFAKPTLTEKPAGGKPVGVKSISVPLESLLQNYVVSYAELLNPGKRVEEQQHLNEEEDDEEENSEQESNDDEEGEKAPPVDGEGEEKKETDRKKKKKKKKQQTKGNYDKFVGEYDLDDPFIDDDEVAVAYESVFDLMDFDGEEDYFDEDGEGSSFDSMNGEMDEAERERRLERREKRRAAKRSSRDPSKPPLRDFYVYRGDLQVEVVSKLKDTAAKKTKKPGKTKAAPPGSPKKKKKAAVEKAESGTASSSAPKSPAKKKEKKAKPKAELTTLERILAIGEEPSATEKATPKPSSSAQVSNEVSTKDSPEKQQARRHFDYDRVFAELEAKLALEAFIAKAKQMEAFEPSKFPSALRDLAAEVAVTGLRLHQSHSDIEDAVFVEMAEVVPYSVVALRKVVFKKIIPLLRQEAAEKRLPALYKELADEASALPLSNGGNGNGNNGSAASAPDSQADPAAKATSKFKFSEKARQIIYEIVKLELDLAFTGYALAVFEAAANGVAPPKPLAHEMTLRRPIYQSILKEWPSPADAPSSMEISSAYGMQKRKLQRRLLKEHGVEMEQRPVEKRPHPLQLDEGNGDVHVDVVDDSVADQPHAKEPRLLLLPEEPQPPSSQPPQQSQGATFVLLPELVNQQQ